MSLVNRRNVIYDSIWFIMEKKSFIRVRYKARKNSLQDCYGKHKTKKK